MTYGIKWLDDAQVPDDERKWLSLALRGYARHNIVVPALPFRIGGFELELSSTSVRSLWWGGKRVGYIVENPKDTGLPADGDKPALQKQPALEKQGGGCGWDPGYGDD